MVAATADVVSDFVPVLGSVKDIYFGLDTGNGWQVAMGVGFLLLDVGTLGSATIVKGVVKQGGKAIFRSAAKTSGNLWKVGSYNKLQGLESGLQAHHVGQKSLIGYP